MNRYIMLAIIIFLLCVFVFGLYISQYGEEERVSVPEFTHPSSQVSEEERIDHDDWQLSEPVDNSMLLASEDDWGLLESDFILLANLEALLKGNIIWEFYPEDKIHMISINERHFQYIEGTDVGKEHHRYFPMRNGIIQTENGSAVCLDFVKFGLGYEIQTFYGELGQRYLSLADGELFVSQIQAFEANSLVKEWTAEQRYERMMNLASPITGAHVTPQASQWPGAPRPYRNGYHEGLDLYSYTSGVIVNKMTDILSMDEGIVLRADHDYIELQKDQREELLEIASQRPVTPDYILDRVRGRSVWIQHSNGVIGRYVHLDQISPDLVVGKPVRKGQVIGKAGNSGTSYGVEGNDEGVHLHLDILIDGQLFWEGLSQEETIGILKKVFSQ